IPLPQGVCSGQGPVTILPWYWILEAASSTGVGKKNNQSANYSCQRGKESDGVMQTTALRSQFSGAFSKGNGDSQLKVLEPWGDYGLDCSPSTISFSIASLYSLPVFSFTYGNFFLRALGDL
ncbi:hypothetical protein BaRGS_00010164, partial [Batillaria attramentaria]